MVEAENTETKRSYGFGRIVKSPSRQNVSKARQKITKSRRCRHLTIYPVKKMLCIAGFYKIRYGNGNHC